MIKKLTFILLCSSFWVSGFSQLDTTFVDTKYFDDQFYFSFKYNALLNPPELFMQNGVSGGIELGYIRDIPINKNRNLGFGIGLGYAYNAYIQNMKISENDNSIKFDIIDTEDYNSNRFATHVLEMPIEFRWRTSSPTNYSFWRVYTGLKVGYVLKGNSRFQDKYETVKVNAISNLNNFQYGLTLSVGYSSLNASVYYGLNNLFKDAQVNGEPIDLRQLNIGLIFYIL